MSETIQPVAEWCAAIIETLGIDIITLTAIYVLFFRLGLLMKQETPKIFRKVRLRPGHGTLLGLEFFVSADIIHTVAVELAFRTVGVLTVIVLIRTFLSFTLEVELTGKWL